MRLYCRCGAVWSERANQADATKRPTWLREHHGHGLTTRRGAELARIERLKAQQRGLLQGVPA